MKQKLSLGISQQLKMTPQLQQAIRLLQLSTLELQQEIQETLYTNPLLEVDEDSPAAEPPQTDPALESAQTTAVESIETAEAEYFSPRKGSASQADTNYDFERETGQSLQDYLEWQLNLSHLSALDVMIGHAIIDSIDDDGMLISPLEDILDMSDLRESLASDGPVELDECKAVLRRIQRFDPPGVGARDLRESLLIQIQLLDEGSLEEPSPLATAKLIADRFLPLVSRGDLAVLVAQSRKTEDQVTAALELLKGLNPRPGSQYNQSEPDYIIPDVVVTKNRGNWAVSLNPETLPKLRLSNAYTEYVSRPNSGDPGKNGDRQYLKDKTREAKWFLKSLESRHDTLLRVAESIVVKQIDFFEGGPEQMRPLILRDLAEELGFHESTISRATNQKYLSCPAGVFELKYFFSSRVAMTSGGAASSTAIKALISKLVREETPQQPLSDSKLVALLKEEGIVVARRTVAKYREMQGIESSSARKRFN